LNLCQANHKPVQTTVIWGRHEPESGAPNDSAELGWNKYAPPTTPEFIEKREEWWEEVQAELGEKKAAEIFLAFITGPYFDKIARCSRCGRFFLNVSGHGNKQFCSSRCARIASAMQSKQRKQHQKLTQLQRAVQKLPPTVKDAKAWLAKKAGVSLHFVTRAVNQGLIQLPGVKQQ